MKTTFKGRELTRQEYADVYMSHVFAVGCSGEYDSTMGVWESVMGWIPVKITGRYRATGFTIEKIVCVDNAYLSREQAQQAASAYEG